MVHKIEVTQYMILNLEIIAYNKNFNNTHLRGIRARDSESTALGQKNEDSPYTPRFTIAQLVNVLVLFYQTLSFCVPSIGLDHGLNSVMVERLFNMN